MGLFPAKTRYTALSVPFHIGNGVFGGGLTPLVATAVGGATKNMILALLTWPILWPLVTAVVPLLRIPETLRRSIWEEISTASPVKKPLTASPLREVVKQMAANEGFVVVVDAANKPVGVVSERDVIKAVASGLSLATPLEAVATKKVITIEPNKPAMEDAGVTAENRIRHLVVAEGKRPAGVVS